MKLLYIPSWYPSESHPSDGAFFKEWAEAFSKNGHDVVVLVNIIHSLTGVFKTGAKIGNQAIKKTSKDRMTEYRSEATNIHPRDEKGFYNRYSKRLGKLFDQAASEGFKPDIAIIHSSVWAGSSIGETLVNNGIPFIVFEHLKELLLTDSITKFQLEAYKRSWANASAIVCVSSAVENSIKIIDTSITNKLKRVPNSINTNFFSQKKRIKNSHDIQFVATALHRKEKRLDYLIRSFSEALENKPNMNLRILGDGPEFNNNKKLINDLGLESKVFLEGFCNKEKVKHILQNSDCLILASEVETFGIAIIEAMSVGIPAISTDCGGPSDIVNENNGILIPVSQETKVLSNAILEMASKVHSYDANLIRNEAIEKYSFEKYLENCEELFSLILKI